MSDYEIVNPIIGMQNIGDTSTTQNQPLGTIVEAFGDRDWETIS